MESCHVLRTKNQRKILTKSWQIHGTKDALGGIRGTERFSFQCLYGSICLRFFLNMLERIWQHKKRLFTIHCDSQCQRHCPHHLQQVMLQASFEVFLFGHNFNMRKWTRKEMLVRLFKGEFGEIMCVKYCCVWVLDLLLSTHLPPLFC